MKKSNICLTTASLLCMSVWALSSVANASDRVLAKYNGKELLKSEVTDSLRTTGEGKLPNDKKDFDDLEPNLKARIINDQVNTKILFEAAQGSKFATTPVFKKKMDIINKMATIQLYLDHEARQKISTSMVRDKYSDYVKALKEHDDRKVAQILVKTEDEAKKVAEEIKSKAISFEDAVKKYSTDAGTKERNGEAGVLSYGSAHPGLVSIEQAAFSTKKGEVSAPVQTQFGWHLIKVLDTMKRKIPSFDEVKEGLEMEMIERQKQQQAAELLKPVNVETFVEKTASK